MTVPYSAELPIKFSSLSWFRTVVCRWHGSVAKVIYQEMAIVIVLWYVVDYAISRCGPGQQDQAHDIILFMRTYQASTRTLLSFMLVFYYQQIYSRAKSIFFKIPWPDNSFFVISANVGDKGELGSKERRACFRLVLATVFTVFHGISAKFRMTYPDPFRSMTRLGLLTLEECEEMEKKFERFPYLSEVSFLPLVWAQRVIVKSFDRLNPDPRADRSVLASVLDSITKCRAQCASVLFEVYLPFPVLLSQLVTILTYCQVALTIVAQQNSMDESEPVFYFPIFTCLETLVYVGALRVGQVYTNPLGADDDDYEVVSFFNRNLRLASIYGFYGDKLNDGETSEDCMHFVPSLDNDLKEVQGECMKRVPVEFYKYEHSKTGVFQKTGEVEERVAAPGDIISTPVLRRSIAWKNR
eukprot:CAMPEP_0118635786 /NCGR_PEP_ID=MMETSP0785-20121206/2261_1 /TAXON_ID=91992 /ORGANISM="Bolidomonas pacifica, Strain CCMP 1866" /LENGTH=411 /DNA_ID=CAMNT_0006526841 /DNA_START=42 /DNA_END=1274 /DNA_ORIENTATION=+